MKKWVEENRCLSTNCSVITKFSFHWWRNQYRLVNNKAKMWLPICLTPVRHIFLLKSYFFIFKMWVSYNIRSLFRTFPNIKYYAIIYILYDWVSYLLFGANLNKDSVTLSPRQPGPLSWALNFGDSHSDSPPDAPSPWGKESRRPRACVHPETASSPSRPFLIHPEPQIFLC